MSSPFRLEKPDGFEVPLHLSLTEPLLLAGIPRTLCLVHSTLSMTLILGLHQIWFIPIALLFHAIFIALTRWDPHFFDILLRALRFPKRLD